MLNTLKITIAVAYLCLMPSLFAYAESAYFSAEIQDEIITIAGTVLYAQDTPYVSLGDLLRSLGGTLQLTPDQCRANYNATTALLKPDTVAVTAPGLSFSLLYPARLHAEDLFLAQPDITDFFARTYQTHIFAAEQGAAQTAVQEKLQQDEDPDTLLEVLSLPSPETEIAPEDAEALLEEITVPEPIEGESITEGEPASEAEPENMVAVTARGTILLDPGHGGKDTGATASDAVTEKDVALAILLKLRSILKETTSLTIHLTRDADKELSQSARAKVANAAIGDLLISIHAGYSSAERANGVIVFTDQLPAPPDAKASVETRQTYTRRRSYGEQAAPIAYSIAKILAEENALGPVTVRTAPLILQRLAEMPCILIEVAYLNNPDVVASITEETYQTHIAESLGRAISAALSQTSP